MKNLFLKKLKTIFYGVCSLFLFVGQADAVNVIKDIRTGQQLDGIRLVIDVKNAKIQGKPKIAKNKLVNEVRFGDLSNVSGKRIVFALKGNVDIKKKFILEPSGAQKNWRLVIDLSMGGESVSTTKATTSSNVNKNVNRKKIVVLDPGHGGKDPGAIGRSYRTYEKNITLQMGKELKRQLEARGYKVYLTRSTDIFIPLRRRVAIARSYHADLFISIHADSTVNRKAQGFSIYTLSETASDKEAEALAERENKADIIDGMDFSDNSPEINDVLISLSQNDSRNKSSKFATYVVNEVRRNVKLVNNAHKFAGFAVLKAPDVPSVLLEMGYLSNYTEEKQLRQPGYRKKLASYMVKAVDRYFKDPEVVL